QSLSVLGTFPFPMNSYRSAFRGDYANLGVTVDLTLARLDQALLKGTPLAGTLTSLQQTLQQNAGLGGMAADPLQAPLHTPSQASPQTQNPPPPAANSLPAITGGPGQ
ncbi:MAG: mammalian cell entry protein, partial [Mycobacteriaceae bacterium]